MARSKDPFRNGFQKHLDAAYEEALAEARRNFADETATEGAIQGAAKKKPKNKDISFGAARLRSGVSQKHERWVGDAHLVVTYRGPREEGGGTLRPMYRVEIRVGGLRHKLSVGGSADWYEHHATPASPEAIDAAAGGAIRFASEADEDTPEEIASVISDATIGALKEDGSYDVRRKP